MTTTTGAAQLIFDPPFLDPQAGPPNAEQDAAWVIKGPQPELPPKDVFVEQWLAERRITKPGGLFASKAAKQHYEAQVREARGEHSEAEWNATGWLQTIRWLDQNLPHADLLRREWGVPGGGLSRGRFGDAAESGRAGEEKTAQILREALADFPGARILHGLRWPTRDYADIDHVVLLHNRLAIVDSKNYKPGHYWWDGSEMYREGEKREGAFEIAQAASDLAVGALCLHPSPDGFIAIHANGPVHVENVLDGQRFPLVAGDKLGETIHAWALQAEQPRRVDRIVLSRLTKMVKES